MLDLIKAHEVAKMLGLSHKTIINLSEQGEIPHCRIGYSYRYSRSVIEKLVTDRIAESTKPKEEATV